MIPSQNRREREFARLVRPHLGKLLNVAQRKLPHNDSAWDCVQDSLVALWQSDDWPNEPERLQGWLVRTVIHRALHTSRSARRAAHYHGIAADIQRTREHATLATRAAMQDLESGLHDALNTMSANFAEVFCLREFEGLTYSEIAERVQVPIGTVRSRLGRARSAVRQALRLKLTNDVCPICEETMDDPPECLQDDWDDWYTSEP